VKSAMADWPRRIGELAAATGVTVRTLHHYDEIGLLVPSRSEAGQRLYTPEDLIRLYQIVALRRLGFGLAEIAAYLNSRDFDPQEVVRRQLADLKRQLELQERLQIRLTVILGALDRAHEPSAEDLINLMEVIREMEQYYTPEQLAKIDTHRQELGEEGLRRGQQAWAELIPLMEAERQRGTNPADPRVQELKRQWQALVEQMTGGDPGIQQGMLKMFESKGPEEASGGHVSPELWAYVRQAYASGDKPS
jgi:DNA-binding transcriptional MerR regulator